MSKVAKEFKRLIRGKEVTKTFTYYQVASVEFIDSDVLAETMQRLVLKKVQNNVDSRDYIMDYGNTGAAQFFQYYLGGYYDYADQLPTVSLGQQLSGIVGLDAAGEAYQLTDYEVYPIVMLRNEYFNVSDYGSTSVNKPPSITQNRYEETVDMLSRLGLSLDDLIDAINDTPQVGNLKDAFFLTGVSPSNTSAIVSKCLYKIFEEIYLAKPLTPGAYTFWNKFTIDYEEGPYNQYLEWIPRAIYDTAGSIGSVGTYSHYVSSVDTYNDNPFQQSSMTSMRCFFYMPAMQYYWERIEVYIEALGGWVIIHNLDRIGNTPDVSNWTPTVGDNVFNFDEDLIRSNYRSISGSAAGVQYVYFDNIGMIQASDVVPSSYYRLHLRYQYADNYYRTLTIDNLFSQTYVTTGSGSKVDQDVTSADLIIPLPIRVVENLSFIERCDLLSHSLHMTFYAVDTQTISYYKGGIFASILKVLSVVLIIVISVISPPAGAALGGVVIGGVAGTALATILGNLFINMLVGMALSIVLKVIMKQVGSNTVKMILSAVVMIVSMYLSGGFQGALDSVTSGLKTAVQLADIPVQMINIYTNDALQGITSAFNALQGQYSTFTEQYEELTKQYSELLNTLNSGISTEFLVGLHSTRDTGATTPAWLLSPSAFYYGAVQSQYDYDSLYSNSLDNYVSTSLTLGILDTQ